MARPLQPFVRRPHRQRRRDRGRRAAAGVPLAPPEEPERARYGVTHSSFVLPFSPDGLAHAVYTQGFHASDYAHDMPLLLAR